MPAERPNPTRPSDHRRYPDQACPLIPMLPTPLLVLWALAGPVAFQAQCPIAGTLSPTTLAKGDRFGASVSALGARVAVGAPGHAGAGAVFLFAFDGATWNPEATVIPNQAGPGDGFGAALALGQDVLVVGAIGDDRVQEDAGAVYVYRRAETGAWRLEETLLPPAPARGFGHSLAIWGDTVAVGEPQAPGGARVHLFRHTRAGWVVEGDAEGEPLGSPDPTSLTSTFGESVALHQDTLAVGDCEWGPAPPDGFIPGRVYLLRRNAGVWSLAHDPIENPSPSDADHFGERVALHGRWLAVGAPQEDPAPNLNSNQGVVYTYRRDNSGRYERTQTLTASSGASADLFGSALALLDDALVVGAPGKTVSGVAAAGAAYRFRLEEGTWTEACEYQPAPQPFDRFGSAVATGGHGVVGAPSDPSQGAGRTDLWDGVEDD